MSTIFLFFSIILKEADCRKILNRKIFMVKKKFYIKPSCTITLAAKIVKIARDYNVEIIIYDSGKEAKAEDIMKRSCQYLCVNWFRNIC